MYDFHMDKINAICPHCGNEKYMYHMSGKNVGIFNVKCTNCNLYFTQEEISAQSELANNSQKLGNENGECNDCIKHGGDWQCDRVHCHKGDVPDTNVGELISRQQAIDVASRECHELRGVFSYIEHGLKELPSVQPRKGKWIRTRTMTHDGELYCDQCEQEHPEQKIIWNFCPNCGADMRGGQDGNK